MHFGRIDAATVEPLTAVLRSVAPHLVVVSGDLTQRAHKHEFAEARAFLKSLPQPQLVVPGNHDIPLHNPLARFLAPLANYRRFVACDTEPHFADDEIVVQGLNTARSLTWKNGRINDEQLELVRRRFRAAPTAAIKIVVTHHPLDLPATFESKHLVGRAERALPVLAECGADVLLAGHFHIGSSGDTSQRYDIKQFAALSIQAGTTTSSRRRDEANSFNLLEVDAAGISVERYIWRTEENVFASQSRETFRRTADGWRRVVVEERPQHEIAANPPTGV